MAEKTASVHWEGPGKQGQGQISSETAAVAEISLRATLDTPAA